MSGSGKVKEVSMANAAVGENWLLNPYIFPNPYPPGCINPGLGRLKLPGENLGDIGPPAANRENSSEKLFELFCVIILFCAGVIAAAARPLLLPSLFTSPVPMPVPVVPSPSAMLCAS